MGHPERLNKAEEIVLAIDKLIEAYVNQNVHMSTNEKPAQQARRELADLLATAIK